MLRKINLEMIGLLVLVILTLVIIAFVLLNTSNMFAQSELGDVAGAICSTCGAGSGS